MNGINPVELVTIPFSEFQRDFPNDPDATQRRKVVVLVVVVLERLT
jgi:hypothetical protein